MRSSYSGWYQRTSWELGNQNRCSSARCDPFSLLLTIYYMVDTFELCWDGCDCGWQSVRHWWHAVHLGAIDWPLLHTCCLYQTPIRYVVPYNSTVGVASLDGTYTCTRSKFTDIQNRERWEHNIWQQRKNKLEKWFQKQYHITFLRKWSGLSLSCKQKAMPANCTTSSTSTGNRLALQDSGVFFYFLLPIAQTSDWFHTWNLRKGHRFWDADIQTLHLLLYSSVEPCTSLSDDLVRLGCLKRLPTITCINQQASLQPPRDSWDFCKQDDNLQKLKGQPQEHRDWSIKNQELAFSIFLHSSTTIKNTKPHWTEDTIQSIRICVNQLRAVVPPHHYYWVKFVVVIIFVVAIGGQTCRNHRIVAVLDFRYTRRHAPSVSPRKGSPKFVRLVSSSLY